MRILLTGTNGYIGMRILPLLLDLGHDVLCCVRDKKRLSIDQEIKEKITVIEIDFLKEPDLSILPINIDAAYYLIHSMSSSTTDFDKKEQISALNFIKHLEKTTVQQVIYLSGIVNEKNLSKHLWSRKNVEEILYKGKYNLTVLRSGIIVGSGSSSFEIIRDLCEKLPIMITPKWVNTKTQPIAIRDVLIFMTRVLGNKKCYNQSFDISGPDILSYKEMLYLYAKVREIKLFIFTIPVMTPKLSSYWLYFVTSTSYKLALNLVDSMKIPVIANNKHLQEMLDITPMNYVKALELAFIKIEQNQVVSSWKDSMVSGRFDNNIQKHISVPKRGCFKDYKKAKIKNTEKTVEKIWTIGGENGWYYGNWVWKIRGYIDKFFGGVGLRRGRTNPDKIFSGDALDFWRVLIADKKNKRLLLFAEMKIPGEAWLEFNIDNNNILHQTATFRPKGIWGRLYWYSMIPFHFFIFSGMIKKIAAIN
ncbi:SDR family oxidoreductase [Aquimarina muelleri]|uniref:Epimerase n=1 Tax=Aquimarina muelleri TaxID=279356 RepID=A0A918N449_9FLAO|nr:SDR family oxidoreductase [Aquimarina muelleri]MCX2762109.1 SDR family oxidoreductase [Aquimarina muelleri]GGX17281.1 epimerase [Aquimarina muelleri]